MILNCSFHLKRNLPSFDTLYVRVRGCFIFAAYCPHGPGMPVIGGHVEDFNMQGEHWAPAFHQSAPNYWVMIGRKYQNSATTCKDNWELEGKEPSWGRSDERTDLKKYLMCCSY